LASNRSSGRGEGGRTVPTVVPSYRLIVLALSTVALLAGSSCASPDLERLSARDLSEAAEALEANLGAIRGRNAEAYLAHYLDSPELVVATPEGVRRGFRPFAEARRASGEWPDTLIAGQPAWVWLAPGVVWGAFEYLAVQDGDTALGLSERVFVKTGDGWRIAVTGSMER
jgi:hypothetical protein